ncbi:MAG: hypothetical protein SVT56_13640 [Chloroflexota bacterium]|nr:hypothetical protein [Chloroflexota bacterium]
MQHKFILPALLSFVLIAFGFISQCTNNQQEPEAQGPTRAQPEEEVPELAEYMTTMQYYTHKFALSVNAENQELAQFYFNEIRALSDQIKEDVPGYEGYEIARFMGIFLDPAIQPVADALQDDDWQETRNQVQQLVDSCNSCHSATSHGFVKVTPGYSKNPYNQDFSE